MGRAKRLCLDNVSIFYVNFEAMLKKRFGHESIWNCDESSAQAWRNGGERVLAKMGICSMHSIIPKEQNGSLSFAM